MLVRKCKPLPVECIVRGYLSGSGWAEYQQTGAIGGLSLPPGLVESQKLPEPIFTPSTKAELGTHDENISFAAMASQIGAALAAKVRDLSLAIYRRALAWAEPRGIIIADTKFEFGLADGAGARKTPPHRRGPDPGLLPLLAPGGLPARRPPKELRQAVSQGLPGIAGLEQATPAAALARRRHRQHPGPLPPGVEDPHRRRVGLKVGHAWCRRPRGSLRPRWCRSLLNP